MDKQTFYAQLAGKLTELGVGEEYINRHLTQFDGYFSDKSDEEVSEEIAKLGSIDRVAARIKRITDKMISDESQTESPADDVSAPEESTVKSEAPQPPREPAARQPQKPPAQPLFPQPMIRRMIKMMRSSRNQLTCARIQRRSVTMGYFEKIYRSDLSHRARAVYMYLKDHVSR